MGWKHSCCRRRSSQRRRSKRNVRRNAEDGRSSHCVSREKGKTMKVSAEELNLLMIDLEKRRAELLASPVSEATLRESSDLCGALLRLSAEGMAVYVDFPEAARTAISTLKHAHDTCSALRHQQLLRGVNTTISQDSLNELNECMMLLQRVVDLTNEVQRKMKAISESWATHNRC